VGDTVRTPQEKMQTESAIGQLLYQQKRYADAADMFAQIATEHPTADAYLSAGQIYAAAKKPEMAKANYDKALALSPNSLKILMQIARDELSTDAGTDAALAAFTKLAEAAKSTGSTDTAAIAEGFLSYHDASKKEWKKVVERLGPAVTTLEAGNSPYRVSFMLLLGESYHQLHEFGKAKEYYEKTSSSNRITKAQRKGWNI